MECPACGHDVVPGDDACGHCGGDLTQVRPPGPLRGRIHELILEDPISQLNAPEPICLSPTDTVATAVERMRTIRYGSVLIVDEGRLVGIFTENDLLRHFASGEADPREVALGDVMTKEPQTVHEDDTIAHALNRMAVGDYRHIPVVRDGRPIGFTSIRGILSYVVENAP